MSSSMFLLMVSLMCIECSSRTGYQLCNQAPAFQACPFAGLLVGIYPAAPTHSDDSGCLLAFLARTRIVAVEIPEGITNHYRTVTQPYLQVSPNMVILPISLGRFPLKLLDCRRSSSNWTRPPSSLGTEPTKKLFCSQSSRRFVSVSNISPTRLPARLFSCALRISSLLMPPHCFGRVPVIPLASM